MKRMVSTDFWTDSKVVDEFSPEDRYFMLYLLTNPHTSPIGIYEFNVKRAAFETGYSIESIITLLERFEMKYEIITYSSKTKEIFIHNFLKYSLSKSGKPVEDMLMSAKNKVKDQFLLLRLAMYYIDRNDVLPVVKLLCETILEEDESLKDENEEIKDEIEEEPIIEEEEMRYVPKDSKVKNIDQFEEEVKQKRKSAKQNAIERSNKRNDLIEQFCKEANISKDEEIIHYIRKTFRLPITKHVPTSEYKRQLDELAGLIKLYGITDDLVFTLSNNSAKGYRYLIYPSQMEALHKAGKNAPTKDNIVHFKSQGNSKTAKLSDYDGFRYNLEDPDSDEQLKEFVKEKFGVEFK